MTRQLWEPEDEWQWEASHQQEGEGLFATADPKGIGGLPMREQLLVAGAISFALYLMNVLIILFVCWMVFKLKAVEFRNTIGVDLTRDDSKFSRDQTYRAMADVVHDKASMQLQSPLHAARATFKREEEETARTGVEAGAGEGVAAGGGGGPQQGQSQGGRQQQQLGRGGGRGALTRENTVADFSQIFREEADGDETAVDIDSPPMGETAAEGGGGGGGVMRRLRSGRRAKSTGDIDDEDDDDEEEGDGTGNDGCKKEKEQQQQPAPDGECVIS